MLRFWRVLVVTLLPLISILNVKIANAFNAEKAPTADAVSSQIGMSRYYRVLLGGIQPSSDGPVDKSVQQIKTEIGSVYEWTSADKLDTRAAHFGASKEDGIWRLTEIHSDLDEKTKKRTFHSQTTSFVGNEVRSKTNCDGLVTDSISCVTATRKFCDRFTNESAAQSGMKLKFGGDDREKSLSTIRRLGDQCTAYAEFLDRTLDPNKSLEGRERAERDDVIKGDLEMLRSVKNNLSRGDVKKLEGLDDRFGNDDKVGVSTTGMKDRAARLRSIGKDFRSLSTLATLCAETKFGTPANAWDLKQKRSVDKKTAN